MTAILAGNPVSHYVGIKQNWPRADTAEVGESYGRRRDEDYRNPQEAYEGTTPLKATEANAGYMKMVKI